MAAPYLKRGTWYLRWKDEAGRWRAKACAARTKTEARQLQGQLERRAERVRLGVEVGLPEDGGGPLAELLQWWLDTYSKPLASHATNESAIRVHFLASELASLPLTAVTAGRVEAFLQAKTGEVSPQMVNHLRGYLSRAFNAARRAGRYPGPNPVLDVRKRKVPRRKPDFLRVHEVPLLLRALDPCWRPLFAAAIYTGLRKGELLALRKSDVDLGRQVLTVARSHDRATTKGGHQDGIPIATELVPFLEVALTASPSELVFPKLDGSMMRRDVNLEHTLRRALGRAGVVEGYRHVCRRKGCGHVEATADQDLRRCPADGRKLWVKPVVRPIRFHDLRHTTGSLLIMSGADLAAVQRILRHSDPKLTTEVYAHLAPEYLRAEVDRLSFGAAVLETVPPFDSAPAARALRSGRTDSEARGFATRLLPDPTAGKRKAGTPRAKAQEVPAWRLERETGFEPATLSLGS
ncbi:site-specific integrase [Anaeromyxobacter sp. Fw109-5]|uniref:tyrosine-type recombinase/integrase n=1 Tax=Anaeromyxobacter sp. (strain Fw109-5) TaxID=404589 RepID=UPI0000ED6E6F|nr:phage integrase family protein [Anaeromyxobacter sp. Fw109-5]